MTILNLFSKVPCRPTKGSHSHGLTPTPFVLPDPTLNLSEYHGSLQRLGNDSCWEEGENLCPSGPRVTFDETDPITTRRPDESHEIIVTEIYRSGSSQWRQVTLILLIIFLLVVAHVVSYQNFRRKNGNKKRKRVKPFSIIYLFI